MSNVGTVFLMYHELSVPGRPLCHAEPGYSRYAVSVDGFRNHLEELSKDGWTGKNVTEALKTLGNKDVCITFDDGCETDLLWAAPLLKEHGFGATFYITISYLGQKGFLTDRRVRELLEMGFEIGCHSMSHPYLTDIDNARLRDETAGAKERLEQICGARVDHFSCPGGRWNSRVADAVRNAGFRTMATSQTGINTASTDPFALARVAVLGHTRGDTLLQTCRGEGLFQARIKETVRDSAKRLLGNRIYDSVRKSLLGNN